MDHCLKYWPRETLLYLLLVCLFHVTCSQNLFAKVVTDGSVGPAQTVSGPSYLIPDTLGTTSGNNLFHSFLQFGIDQNQSITFTGPDTISNVISRVTGNEISTIDGQLQSQVGQANFYFINPNGIVFGPNAQVNVPAAFHASTASELRFEDGYIYSSAASGISTLTQAEPQSFGFLAPQSGSILVNGTELTFRSEKKVSLSGSNISIKGPEAGINVPGGDIHITAVGSSTTGEVPVAQAPEISVNGMVSMDSSALKTTGNSGGRIVVTAGDIKMDDAVIEADNTSDSDATYSVELAADNTFEMTGSSSIERTGFYNGDTGAVIIHTNEMSMDDQSAIRTDTEYGSTCHAGNIEIFTDGLLNISDGAQIISMAGAAGNAGDVTIRAYDIVIDDLANPNVTGIFSQTYLYTDGHAGLVDVRADNKINILNGAKISSDTWGKGHAGNVIIHAETLKMDNSLDSTTFGISSTAGFGSSGNAGTVDVVINDSLDMANGAQIASETYSQGNGGNVTIKAGEIKIRGKGDFNDTGILTQSAYYSWGNAGDIDITVDSLLDMGNGSEISSETAGFGRSGNIVVNTGALKIDGNGISQFTGITSEANASSFGHAGTVEVYVDNRAEMINGGQISSDTLSVGNAGTVIVKAEDMIIDNMDYFLFTGITSETGLYSTGDAGSIEVSVKGLLALYNSGHITSSSFGTGSAGDISILSDTIYIDGLQTGIFSLAYKETLGYVGNIIIQANDIHLTNQADISIQADQTLTNDVLAYMPGNSIQIYTDTLYLNNNAWIRADSSVNVPAGDIRIQADNIVVENNSRITTSSNDADAGDILISGKTLFINDGLITTSVTGTSGDGGDINITGTGDGELLNPSDALALRNGFIQANTGADQAQGGDITINVNAVVKEAESQLLIGGTERYSFLPGQNMSVIQAAAPGGEQGNINITAPDIDISNAISGSSPDFQNPARVATDPCLVSGKSNENSLVHGGRGGLPPTPDNLSTISLTSDRLDQLLK